MSARDELVRCFMPLASRLARRFRFQQEGPEDLEQVAFLGLIKAIDRYEVELGAFPRFAVPSILGELRRHLRDRAWAVHVPRSVHEALVKVNRVTADLSSELGRTPRVSEISKRSGLEAEAVAEAIDAGRTRRPLDLDGPASATAEDAPPLREAVGHLDPHYEYVELGEALAPTFRSLSSRDQRILKLRLIDDLDQRQIAERLGISQMHVSRLLRRSFDQLAEATGNAA